MFKVHTQFLMKYQENIKKYDEKSLACVSHISKRKTNEKPKIMSMHR